MAANDGCMVASPGASMVQVFTASHSDDGATFVASAHFLATMVGHLFVAPPSLALPPGSVYIPFRFHVHVAMPFARPSADMGTRLWVPDLTWLSQLYSHILATGLAFSRCLDESEAISIIAAAIGSLPVASLAISSASAFYLTPPQPPAAPTWFDCITPAMFAGRDESAWVYAQFLSLIPGAFTQSSRSRQPCADIIHQLPWTVGHRIGDIQGQSSSMQAALIAQFFRDNTLPLHLVFYPANVAQCVVEFTRRSFTCGGERYRPLFTRSFRNYPHICKVLTTTAEPITGDKAYTSVSALAVKLRLPALLEDATVSSLDTSIQPALSCLDTAALRDASISSRLAAVHSFILSSSTSSSSSTQGSTAGGNTLSSLSYYTLVLPSPHAPATQCC